MSKILVVDDSEAMRLTCGELLTEHGHEVVVARNGREAIAIYQAAQPDAVLLDVTMPDMDGLTALSELQELDPDVRVAMVTALGREETVVEALQAGAKDFIVKPYSADRVLAAVRRISRAS